MLYAIRIWFRTIYSARRNITSREALRMNIKSLSKMLE